MILLGFPVTFFVIILSFFILLLTMAPQSRCLHTLMVNFKNIYAMINITIPEVRKPENVKEKFLFNVNMRFEKV